MFFNIYKIQPSQYCGSGIALIAAHTKEDAINVFKANYDNPNFFNEIAGICEVIPNADYLSNKACVILDVIST